MRTFTSTSVVASVGIAFGLMLWGKPERLEAAPKIKRPAAAIYVPTTVQMGEVVRVSVVNDDPAIITLSYTIRLIDVQTGSTLYQQDTGPVQPLTGVVQDVNVTQTGREDTFVIISASSDLSTGHPMSLSSVQIVDGTSNTVLRHTPHRTTNIKTTGSGDGYLKLAPAIYAPATLLAGEEVRVSLFNDNPDVAVEYVSQLVDALTGAIVETMDTGPVQPEQGVVLDHTPHNGNLFLVIRGLDPDGAPYPVSIASVQITDPTTNLIRFVPASSHTYGSGTGAH